MAKYKALWTVHGPKGLVAPGSILDLDDDSAAALLELGAIEPAPEKEKPAGKGTGTAAGATK